MSSAYCRFAPGDPIHGLYHDTEYGFPTHEESALFERLMLEINQAGLSWATILKKRTGFRAAFADFAVDRVAAFGPAEIDRLRSERARILGDGEPRLGAHDKPVLFLHPKDFCGTLIELEQV